MSASVAESAMALVTPLLIIILPAAPVDEPSGGQVDGIPRPGSPGTEGETSAEHGPGGAREHTVMTTTDARP